MPGSAWGTDGAGRLHNTPAPELSLPLLQITARTAGELAGGRRADYVIAQARGRGGAGPGDSRPSDWLAGACVSLASA